MCVCFCACLLFNVVGVVGACLRYLLFDVCVFVVLFMSLLGGLFMLCVVLVSDCARCLCFVCVVGFFVFVLCVVFVCVVCACLCCLLCCDSC